MDDIYLNIGGFFIKVGFEYGGDFDPKMEYARKVLTVDLFVYLREFIISSKPHNIDFEIFFKNTPEIEVLRTNDNNIEYTPLSQWITNKKIIAYSKISIYQFERILKNVMFRLLEKNGGFGIHASAVKVGDNAYLFLGESGAGKSTIVELLNGKYQVLTDDITLIRKINSKYFVLQTPFFEKVWWIKKNQSLYEIGKMFFIHQSKEFSIETLSEKTNVPKMVLNQVLAAQKIDNKMLKDALSFIKGFDKYYDLHFDKNSDGLRKLITSTYAHK